MKSKIEKTVKLEDLVADEEAVKEPVKEGVVGTIDDYLRFLNEAKFEDVPKGEYLSIELTDRVFDKVKPGKNIDTFLTSSGVVVFRAGTDAKAIFDSTRAMTAEEFMQHEHQRRRAQKTI
jgi:hypothetical protein